VFLIGGLVLSYGAALASLGLALATWMPRAGWVATLGVAAHVLVTVGWFFVVVVATQGARRSTGTGLGSASRSSPSASPRSQCRRCPWRVGGNSSPG